MASEADSTRFLYRASENATASRARRSTVTSRIDATLPVTSPS
jgi:hypothetical protein